MYKAVAFFDLDGTFLRDDKSIPKENIQVVEQLRKNNVLPVISTGRNIFEIQYVVDTTGMNSLVSANGSYVQYEGKKLQAETIKTDLISDLISFAKSQGDVVAYYNNLGFALSAENDMTRNNYHLLKLDAHVDPDFYKTHEINFMNVYNFDKDELYQERYEGRLSLVRNNPRCMDTMNWGISKQTGIQALLRKTGLASVPTYGFGDQLNDLQMFDEVDHAVVMGNGNPIAKKRADFITSSNMEGGIVKGLQHYGLI